MPDKKLDASSPSTIPETAAAQLEMGAISTRGRRGVEEVRKLGAGDFVAS
jgi:hypothetical protein